MKKLTSLEAGTGGRVLRMAIVLSVAVGLATFAVAQQKKKTRRLGIERRLGRGKALSRFATAFFKDRLEHLSIDEVIRC